MSQIAQIPAQSAIIGANIVFIGKINCSFSTCRQREQAMLPTRDFAPQPAFESGHRGRTLTLGFCSEQIGKTLDLRQIKPSVFKSAPGKGSRLCWTKSRQARQDLLYRRNDGSPAVKM